MTPRSIRRAAERKARKAEQKRLRHLPQSTAQAPDSVLPQSITPQYPEPQTLISEAQVTANRANAQHSTGPISPEGKAVSSRNRFSHGLTQTGTEDLILLPSESAEKYAQSLAAYRDEWKPATATEQDLVQRLASHRWLRCRALSLQSRFLDPETGLIADEKQFNLYRRYEVQHERAYNKAFSDLMRLRALHLRERNGFESQRRKNEKHEYQLRAIQHREKLRQYAEITAQARLALVQSKLSAFKPAASTIRKEDFLATAQS